MIYKALERPCSLSVVMKFGTGSGMPVHVMEKTEGRAPSLTQAGVFLEPGELASDPSLHAPSASQGTVLGSKWFLGCSVEERKMMGTEKVAFSLCK